MKDFQAAVSLEYIGYADLIPYCTYSGKASQYMCQGHDLCVSAQDLLMPETAGQMSPPPFYQWNTIFASDV